MPQAFYEVASTTAEDIQIPRMRVAPEILLDLKRQGVHAAPHVGHATRQPDTNTSRNRDHRRARTASTRASAEPSTSRSTITRAIGQRDLHPSRRRRIPRGSTQRRRLQNHRHQAAGPASLLAKPAPAVEHQVGVHVVAPRHNRHRNPRLVALRYDPRRFSASLQRRRRAPGPSRPDSGFSIASDICDRVGNT